MKHVFWYVWEYIENKNTLRVEAKHVVVNNIANFLLKYRTLKNLLGEAGAHFSTHGTTLQKFMILIYLFSNCEEEPDRVQREGSWWMGRDWHLLAMEHIAAVFYSPCNKTGNYISFKAHSITVTEFIITRTERLRDCFLIWGL